MTDSLYINCHIIVTQCTISVGTKPSKVQFVLLSQYEILLYAQIWAPVKKKRYSQCFCPVQDITNNGWLFSVTARLCFVPVSRALVLGVLIWLSVLCLESLCTQVVTLSDYRPFCLRRALHLCVCVCVCVWSVALVFTLESLTEAPVGPFVVVSWRGLRGSGFECEWCHERLEKGHK